MGGRLTNANILKRVRPSDVGRIKQFFVFVPKAQHYHPSFFALENFKPVTAFDLCDVLQRNWLYKINLARQQGSKASRCVTNWSKYCFANIVLSCAPPSGIWGQNSFDSGIAAGDCKRACAVYVHGGKVFSIASRQFCAICFGPTFIENHKVGDRIWK